jgi:PAS domain S-box-containing protein
MSEHRGVSALPPPPHRVLLWMSNRPGPVRMSSDPDPPAKRTPRRSATPVSGLALPLAYWQEEVARGRERFMSSRSALGSLPDAATDELLRTYEELAVAEEELRVQNEGLLRAQELLDSERDRYHHLFEHAPVPYFVTDEYGLIQEANQTLALLLATRRRHLIGKPFVVFMQDASRRRFRSTLSALEAATDSATVSLNVARQGSRIIRVEATAAVVRNVDGQLVEIRWLLVDRTRRARVDRARRRRNAELGRLVAERTAELERAQTIKDQLLATVSHEFRTGLAAIGGYADLLEIGIRGPLSEAQLGDVRSIRSAYVHLAALIDDLLDYSRIAATGTAPTFRLDISDVVLSDAIRNVAGMVGPQALARSIMLSVEDCPAIVARADVERLGQILLNLLGNAVKFTPPGGRIQIRSRATETDAFVEVDDTGPGIPEERREEVFHPFVRLFDSAVPGTGLGLTISRDLARAMDGDIVVSANDDGGSRFVLRLPRSTRFASKSPQG